MQAGEKSAILPATGSLPASAGSTAKAFPRRLEPPAGRGAAGSSRRGADEPLTRRGDVSIMSCLLVFRRQCERYQKPYEARPGARAHTDRHRQHTDRRLEADAATWSVAIIVRAIAIKTPVNSLMRSLRRCCRDNSAKLPGLRQ